MTYDSNMKKLWTIADKPERMRCFHTIVFSNDGFPKAFWSNFWDIWITSENLNEDINIFSELIDYGLSHQKSIKGISSDDRKSLRMLPPVIEVYRGCLEHNQEGWSWTIDKDKAKWFADRAYGEGEGLLLCGKVNKADVLAYLSGRNEKEIVVNPDNVFDISIETVPNTIGSPIYYAVQSGKFDDMMGENIHKIRAEMMFQTMKPPFDHAIKHIEETLDFIKWTGIKTKRKMLEELLVIMQKSSKPKEVDFNFSM